MRRSTPEFANGITEKAVPDVLDIRFGLESRHNMRQSPL
jgi:hypothetical protein